MFLKYVITRMNVCALTNSPSGLQWLTTLAYANEHAPQKQRVPPWQSQSIIGQFTHIRNSRN